MVPVLGVQKEISVNIDQDLRGEIMTFRIRRIAVVALLSCVVYPQTRQNQRIEKKGPPPAQSSHPARGMGGQQIIAYVSPAKGTAIVLRQYRSVAATALRAQVLSDSEWLIQQENKPVRLKVLLQDAPTLPDEKKPTVGEIRVVTGRKCSGNVPMQDTGCVRSDVGAERVVRLGHSTCQAAENSSCEEVFIDVTEHYSYIDQECKKQTAKRVVEQAWVCLP
jgi:hypothetical protein